MRIFFVAIAAVILQITALAYVRIGTSTFNLELIILVFVSLKYGPKPGIWLGLFFGAVNGIFAIDSFWVNVLLYSAIGSITGYLGRWFYKETLPAFLLMIFCSLAFLYFFLWLLKMPYPDAWGALAGLSGLFAASAAYNTGISIVFFYLLKGLRV
ncbi:MAG: hypothetical protein PHO42_05500 [Candidatus Omnitrophica bacterium]|nr:hypothetical protein [Candidatus Omnitrophota bacterium]